MRVVCKEKWLMIPMVARPDQQHELETPTSEFGARDNDNIMPGTKASTDVHILFAPAYAYAPYVEGSTRIQIRVLWYSSYPN